MIIVDTSVWIDFFNGTDSAEAERLDSALENDSVAIGDYILLEILQGLRSDSDYAEAKSMLGRLLQYEMLGPDLALRCAENYRYLRKQGVTVRKTADIVIATFCIGQEIPLLFTDRDFVPFVERLGLVSAL